MSAQIGAQRSPCGDTVGEVEPADADAHRLVTDSAQAGGGTGKLVSCPPRRPAYTGSRNLDFCRWTLQQAIDVGAMRLDVERPKMQLRVVAAI